MPHTCDDSCNPRATAHQAIDADLPGTFHPRLGYYDSNPRDEDYYFRKAHRRDYGPAVGVALALVTAAAVYGALVAALL